MSSSVKIIAHRGASHDAPEDAPFLKRVHDADRARYFAELDVDDITTDGLGWIRESLSQEAASK
jgi:glycerophosphoryl diester phosphodiesterase